MADRFWVLNSGSANDTTHWSLTSGGAGSAGAPSTTINAKLDANSFSLAGQIVTTTSGFSCLDMDWTGAINNPTLAVNSSFNVFGSLTFISAMTVTGTSSVSLRATSTGKTVTMAGKSLPSNIIFSGVGGGWTLQDALTAIGSITLSSGSLDTNGKTISCLTFQFLGSTTRTLTLGVSTITCSGSWLGTTTIGLTFSGASSTINLTGSGTTFDGGGLTYGIVNLQNNITISGSNTIATLSLTSNKTYNFTAGDTQTVSNLTASGTLGNLITIQSTVNGSAWNLVKSSGVVNFEYCTIKDCHASGGATFYARNCIDAGGNTGITFLYHNVNGQRITKVNGATPRKVNGI